MIVEQNNSIAETLLPASLCLTTMIGPKRNSMASRMGELFDSLNGGVGEPQYS